LLKYVNNKNKVKIIDFNIECFKQLNNLTILDDTIDDISDDKSNLVKLIKDRSIDDFFLIKYIHINLNINYI
jgi:hypothetical protein